MRICLYTATALPLVGGQEMVVDSLARYLTHQGHHVVVLAPRPTRFRRLRVFDDTKPYIVRRHPRFFSMRRWLTWYGNFLIRCHRQNRFDVIHAHEVYPTAYIAARCRRHTNVPLVITSHGGDVHAENRHLNDSELVTRYRRSIAAADSLIAISRFTRDGLSRLMTGADEKTTDIPNGVELADFSERVSRPDTLSSAVQPGGYFLFLGRLDERKGVDVLFRAFAALPAGQRLSLVVAGDGRERARLQQLAHDLSIANDVHWTGMVQGAVKTYLTQNSRCLIAPSRQWEAFGLIVVESFASGRPVIASRLPGMADLINPGHNGELVAPESVQELSNQLRRAAEFAEQWDAMGRQAWLDAQAYDWSRIARRHVACYEQARDQSKCRPAA